MPVGQLPGINKVRSRADLLFLALRAARRAALDPPNPPIPQPPDTRHMTLPERPAAAAPAASNLPPEGPGPIQDRSPGMPPEPVPDREEELAEKEADGERAAGEAGEGPMAEEAGAGLGTILGDGAVGAVPTMAEQELRRRIGQASEGGRGGTGRGRAVRCEVIFDIIQRKHVRTCTYIYQLCILWYYILARVRARRRKIHFRVQNGHFLLESTVLNLCENCRT